MMTATRPGLSLGKVGVGVGDKEAPLLNEAPAHPNYGRVLAASWGCTERKNRELEAGAESPMPSLQFRSST